MDNWQTYYIYIPKNIDDLMTPPKDSIPGARHGSFAASPKYSDEYKEKYQIMYDYFMLAMMVANQGLKK